MSEFGLVSARDLHSWRVFQLVEATFAAASGEEFTRTFLRHPGAVGIVAVDGDEAILVRQFRAALGRDLLEIPAGTLDKGADETPAACAARELAEETGATAGSIIHLTTYAVAPGISDEVLHLYLATDLRFGDRRADGIEEEAMTVERLPLASVPAAIADGHLEDAKTMLGLLLARSHLSSSLPSSPSLPSASGPGLTRPGLTRPGLTRPDPA